MIFIDKKRIILYSMNGKFDLQNKDDKFSGIFLSTLVVGTKVCGWQTLDIPSPYTFALLENGKVDFYCDYMIWFQFQFQFGLSLFFFVAAILVDSILILGFTVDYFQSNQIKFDKWCLHFPWNSLKNLLFTKTKFYCLIRYFVLLWTIFSGIFKLMMKT